MITYRLVIACHLVFCVCSTRNQTFLLTGTVTRIPTASLATYVRTPRHYFKFCQRPRHVWVETNCHHSHTRMWSHSMDVKTKAKDTERMPCITYEPELATCRQYTKTRASVCEIKHVLQVHTVACLRNWKNWNSFIADYVTDVTMNHPINSFIVI